LFFCFFCCQNSKTTLFFSSFFFLLREFSLFFFHFFIFHFFYVCLFVCLSSSSNQVDVGSGDGEDEGGWFLPFVAGMRDRALRRHKQRTRGLSLQNLNKLNSHFLSFSFLFLSFSCQVLCLSLFFSLYLSSFEEWGSTVKTEKHTSPSTSQDEKKRRKKVERLCFVYDPNFVEVLVIEFCRNVVSSQGAVTKWCSLFSLWIIRQLYLLSLPSRSACLSQIR